MALTRITATTPPLNSHGEPYQPGQVWTCSACGESGPDNDCVRLTGCKAHPSRLSWAPHSMTFSIDTATKERP